ncbi:hypothetical protein KOR42_48100 [Thalassoglobus neptunius]|uniref:Uncharacterized protein n=1 Tax=Thalassoglobus neptunius TaxID=1938619 RepID=A0A5C5VTJ1_9PLAN|nr:hypothetical protein [Thalassoglobus neptunius]TWT41457.1 hypothetical protein KOR42_48100 [Thalassoglobus neptunius]
MSESNFAGNQSELCEALGITSDELDELKSLEGFPKRTAKGWDVSAISEWLSAENDSNSTPSEMIEEPIVPEMEEQAEELKFITLAVPVSEPIPGSYVEKQRGHIDVKLRSPEVLHGFKRIHAGLRAANAKLSDGRPVVTAADVARYIAEKLTQSTT